MSYENHIEELTDKAHMASELRLLGFSEYAIKGILEMTPYQINETIRKYKDAVDLMGDSTE